MPLVLRGLSGSTTATTTVLHRGGMSGSLAIGNQITDIDVYRGTRASADATAM